MKDLMNFEHRWKLRDWIDEEKLNWSGLHENPNAIFYLEAHQKFTMNYCSMSNPSAMYLLEKIKTKLKFGGIYH